MSEKFYFVCVDYKDKTYYYCGSNVFASINIANNYYSINEAYFRLATVKSYSSILTQTIDGNESLLPTNGLYIKEMTKEDIENIKLIVRIIK